MARSKQAIINELKDENAKLKTAIRKHLKTDDVYWLENAIKGESNEKPNIQTVRQGR